MTGGTTDASVGGSAISLPKGGGAVSGLGEKFAPDLFTGTGNFSVPIESAAGAAQPAAPTRAGLQHRRRQRPVRVGLGTELARGIAEDVSRSAAVPRR